MDKVRATPRLLWASLAILSLVGSSCQAQQGSARSHSPKPGSAEWLSLALPEYRNLSESERRQVASVLADPRFLKKSLSDQKEALRQVDGLRSQSGESDHPLEFWLEVIHGAMVPGLSRVSLPPFNDDLAVSQLRSIADSGDAFAQYYAGFVYELRKDSAECARWWRRAAEQGLSDAQSHLGELYENGAEGVPADVAESLRWYLKAAGQGDIIGQSRLGRIYRDGAQQELGSSDRAVSASRFLDRLEEYINTQAKQYEKAVFWFRKAADQGNVGSQLALAEMYHEGQGVLRNYAEAVTWYRKAATKGRWGSGSSDAKYNLGLAYERGEGVPQDFVLAYMWFNLAAADNVRSAQQHRDGVSRKMSTEQVAHAQELAQHWKPSGNAPDSTGTGFFVGRAGYLVTNYHVIDGCSALKTKAGALSVIGGDQGNDLALLKSMQPVSQVAAFSSGPVRIGQFAMVVGYPLRGLLSSGANVTTGNVSALAGPNDDTRLLQITAPVQPGNSGGPLLDQSGNVIGVVVSKLDTLKVARATGDIPQNVNFAIKGAVVRSFLEAHGIEFSTSASTAKVDPSVIAEQASKATVVVECWK